MELDISESMQNLVREHGNQVLIDTQTCVLWKAEHENCNGCSSELGCSKTVGMLGVSMTSMLYQPKDFTDYENMNRSIQDKLDKILNAKTVKEIHKVRW